MIVWMAGLVIGAGIGVVLVYHMLLARHAETTRPFHDRVTAPVSAAALTTDEIRKKHAQALQDAMKPIKS